MKRSLELRSAEFNVQKLRDSHDTIQRFTSQEQELQERTNYLNDSWITPRSRVELVENVHRFPVNQQGFQVHAL